MLKIMIVDNETAIRKGLVYCIRWETLDCRIVAQAEDGIDALEQIPKTLPDVVISDIRMPGMDGLELARRLSEDWPQIKVILLTGFPDFKYAQRAIEYRVADFILKPASVESLTSAVEKVRAQLAEERSSRSLQRELQSQSEQTLLLERSLFLRDLIRNVQFSHLFALNRAAQLGLNLSSYCVLFFQVFPVSSDRSESELLADLGQAQKILADCLDDFQIHFITHGSQNGYAVVCAPESAPLPELCSDAADVADSLPRFSLSIGISLHANDPLDMARAAEQAEQAMQFAQYSPERTVKRFDQIPAIPGEVTAYIFSELKLLKSAIENRSHTAASDIMRRLFDFIRQNQLPIKTVRNICIYIYNFCISLLFAVPDSEGGLAEDKLPPLRELLEGGSPETLEQNMLAFAERMLSLDAAKPADTEGVIRSVKDYVAQHYAEELSLEGLAAQVYLSPSYMSKLFKRETGENLSTYIQKVRIDEAKLLLRTTGLKTYKVALRVGIPDPVYFSRIFKKLTGIKPKDFRSSEPHAADRPCDEE